MEKVYKHKKTGQIAYYKDGVFKQNNCSVEIGVEPSKQFWEEIIFDIISFINLEEQIFVKNEIGIFKTEMDDELNDFGNWRTLKHIFDVATDLKIYSVKRLYDNEIFSIGDKINFRGLYGSNSEHKYDTIKGFEFKQDGSLGVRYHNGLVGIEKIQKYKEALFTTKDGVELFGGERVFSVSDTLITAVLLNFSVEDFKKIKGKIFAKKEKAEEYILMNKPLLSLNDLLSVWSSEKDFDAYKNSPMFQNFKNLAKTKL